MFDINRFLNSFSADYYSTTIMFVVELTALIAGIKYWRKDKMGRVFIFYIAFDFTILCSDIIINSLRDIPAVSYSYFVRRTNTLIALAELFTYYYFFYTLFPDNKTRRWIGILCSVYATLILLYLITDFSFLIKNVTYVTYTLGAIEFILLLPFCFLYYKQMLNTTSKIELLKRPSFWVITGIFFFCLVSIPYYLLYDYFRNNRTEFHSAFVAAFYYIPFTINFLFLIKAALCKKSIII